jgi:hypothetical protein
MKRCPGCYAIMRESSTLTQSPKFKHQPADSTAEVSPVKVRFECSQCGHMEEEFAKPVPAQKV